MSSTTDLATSTVKLWIDNEQDTQNMAFRMAQDAREAAPTSTWIVNGICDERDAARYILADALEEWVTGQAPDLPVSMFSDLLTQALSMVNWDALAIAVLSDYAEIGMELE